MQLSNASLLLKQTLVEVEDTLRNVYRLQYFVLKVFPFWCEKNFPSVNGLFFPIQEGEKIGDPILKFRVEREILKGPRANFFTEVNLGKKSMNFRKNFVHIGKRENLKLCL